MGTLHRDEVIRVLDEALSIDLRDSQIDDLMHRLELQSEQLEVLRHTEYGVAEPLPGWVPPAAPAAGTPGEGPVTLPATRPTALLETLSLAEVSRDLRRGELSPLELVENCLRRIENLDGDLNSFITVTGDRAVDHARQLTEELAQGRWRGPLHGVPLGLKDLIETEGVRTTAGSRILAGSVPARDATVVRRLREAGAISLGKLHMHEFAFGATGENEHYGRSVHPTDPSRLTGGSSSGSAAAVAAHLCYGALGSDTGGSIRNPAALCGLVGIKPTYGRVSRAGVIPLAWSLDHVGPLARTVTDAALMLESTAGYDPADPTTAQVPVPTYSRGLEEGVRGLKLGVPREFFWSVIQPGVEQRVREAIAVLEAEGAEIREISLATLELAAAAQNAIICAEATAFHREWLRTRADEYGRGVFNRLLYGLFISSSDYLAAQRARCLVQQDLLRALGEVDALLTPAVPVVAPVPGEPVRAGDVVAPSQYYMVRNTYVFNHTGLPALSVPCGLSEGLPVGLQIAGRPWEEGLILRVARAYERATRG